ncbi:MAG: flagellar basal body rod protein FlgC [Victivallales bacterium]|nr:flagellar basal body rod protein FlgC [Victivallales bacterium]
MIDLIPAGKISAGALQAERMRMDIVANNLANAHSVGQEGSVYQRKVAIFAEQYNDELGGDDLNGLDGVELTEIATDTSRAPTQEYMPFHPEADADGMVLVPNISPLEEMVDMIAATRAYEANLSILRDSRKMADSTIDILKS